MKKRLVAYLMISVLAATVFAGCGKKGGDAAAAADTAAEAVAAEAEDAAAEAEAPAEEAAATEEAAPAEEAAAAEETAPVEEAVVEETSSIDATAAEAVAADAGEGEEAVAEEKVEEGAEEAVAEDAAAAETEDLIVDPGTQYTVRFGGNVYASPDQNDANIIDYVYPGYVLTIDERLDDFWYAITYWIDGAARTGYIKIQ